jgi:hypothetical protein
MAGEREYTRIPPESTGDRVGMVHTAVITPIMILQYIYIML